ncbi:MAG: hypothetical protein RLZZ337_1279 [Bacteroidota bacterium]|jgi:5'(3')-deoxyribonucleotidase
MKPIIFLDMDSVVVNWTDPIINYLDISADGNNIDELRDRLTEEHSKEIDILMENYLFWRSLKPFAWSKELVNKVSEMGDLYFLTKGRPNHSCFGGKIEWIKQYFPAYQDNLVITSKDKFVCSSSNNFLIDDDERHKLPWEKRGGKFFHWKEMREENFSEPEFKKRLVAIQLLVDTYKHGI